jgi:3-oxoacyl-[acyl-carrier-protein] synthase III
MMKQDVRPTFIRALAYELGEEVHNLDELTRVSDGTRRQLREGGLRTYRVSQRSPVELARVPIEHTLAGVDREECESIRRVIFATNSFDDGDTARPGEISGLLIEQGLSAAFPIGVFLSFCANFHSALELARALIESGREDTVLVVCSDVLDKNHDRIVSPKISVHSDAAVSFVMSACGGPYRVLETRLRGDAQLAALNRETQFLQYMDGVSRAVVGLVEDMLAAVELTSEDITRVLPNNYNRWVCRSMAELVGFSEERLFLDNIPRFAHALAADNPINLLDVERAGLASAGDVIALLGSGAFQWGCTLLQVE